MATIGLAIPLRIFELWCRREDKELHYLWTHFFVFLDVLTWVWKVQLRAFRIYFYFVNVATIGLAIPLRFFWALMQERGKGITLFLEPFLGHFRCSYMVLKDISYCFQGKKRIPKLSKKWVFKKSESVCFYCCINDQNSKIKLYNQYSMDSQNKDIFWKLWYISFQPTQQHPKWIKMCAIIL